ncbi:hypothetical protein K8P03_11025 [Anaerococcus murdochii]|uniref:Phage protein n=1 Tax=Anaerococcus murdochii TaxID=411577 RepID=A0ABS7T201_9FIRM|nr:hypothetical protein [Anaerococcus murdochii]MBZ2387804.1 hypothetical protein [Anaerococcus murdochii]
MRIDELKKIAKENEYDIEIRYQAGCEEIVLYSNHYGIIRQVAVINNEVKNIIFISNGSCSVNDLNVIKASIKYAETDPEDREEEKKFYLKHRYLRSTSGNILYFSIYIEYDFSILTYRRHSSETKQQFTLKEIEEIKKKFDTDLKDFELVEVEE